MDNVPIKVCSGCGAEYSPDALICVDCGGTLVFPADARGHLAPLAEEEAGFLVREGVVDYVKELARELGRNGIRSAIVFHAPGPGT